MLQFANVHFAFHNIHKTSLRFRTFTKLPFLNFASEHIMVFPLLKAVCFFFFFSFFIGQVSFRQTEHSPASNEVKV